ncbi:hypothetical protein HGRIS_009114 [Hohenbuehelia grisea]|uniref:Heterokaryon incompatibility domain-containing protein n=1 Tax=Hohenbuehelia grisea TaxID=104357 RepID=A0ABR3J0B2_9AGAR
MIEVLLSLKETLEICKTTTKACEHPEQNHRTPLRLLRPSDDGSWYNVVPFEGQEYLAISYCWPSHDWVRIHDSNTPARVLRLGEHLPHACPNFSIFAQKAVENATAKAGSLVWLDYECIAQNDGAEKSVQVHVMDKIYNKATHTVILLEDVEISTAELAFLQTQFLPEVTTHFDKYTRLVRRILGARWFTRAWCAQELILGRYSSFFVHRSDNPGGPPIVFSLPTLKHWIARASMHDPSINEFKLSDPRGLNPKVMRAGNFGNTMAWAFGVIHSLRCLNPYDKLAIVDNLIQADVSARVVALPVVSSNRMLADENVVRIVNVLAILRGDFSLLLTTHVASNSLRGIEGFRWAGLPLPGDIVSESWSPRAYEVEKAGEVSAEVDSGGIMLKGVASRVLEQTDWSFYRDIEGLHVTLNDEHHLIASDWLRKKYPTSRALQPDQAFFRDFLYVIEGFNLVEVYRLVFDAVNDEWFHDERYGDLKSHIQRHFSAYSPSVMFYASRLSFMRDGGACGFTVVKVEGDVKLLVKGNVSELRGKTIFQPYVIRPKEFSTILPTVNSFVLDDVDSGESSGMYQCIGGVRGFGLVPAMVDDMDTCVHIF